MNVRNRSNDVMALVLVGAIAVVFGGCKSEPTGDDCGVGEGCECTLDSHCPGNGLERCEITVVAGEAFGACVSVLDAGGECDAGDCGDDGPDVDAGPDEPDDCDGGDCDAGPDDPDDCDGGDCDAGPDDPDDCDGDGCDGGPDGPDCDGGDCGGDPEECDGGDDCDPPACDGGHDCDPPACDGGDDCDPPACDGGDDCDPPACDGGVDCGDPPDVEAPPALVNPWVAFTSDPEDRDWLYVARASGSDVTRIDTGDLRHYDATWAPDGRRIAFITPGPTAPVLRVVDVTTGEVSDVAHGLATLASLSWSPDGEEIAAEGAVTPGVNNDIFIIPVDGSGAVAVTDDPASESGPAWVQDHWIYFVSNRTGTFDAWRHDLDTGAEEPVTVGGEILGAVSVSWDLARLLFLRRAGPDESELVLYEVESETALVVPAYRAREPIFARDGRVFAYVTQDDGGEFDLVIADAFTGATIGLVTDDAASEQMPEIGPVNGDDVVLAFPLPED